MSPDADLYGNIRGKHHMLQKARAWACQLLEFTFHVIHVEIVKRNLGPGQHSMCCHPDPGIE